MPAQLELEREIIRREREKSAAERRDRNALAIAEVVGRNAVKPLPGPADLLRRLRDPYPRNN